jgi:hypothetical protein
MWGIWRCSGQLEIHCEVLGSVGWKGAKMNSRIGDSLGWEVMRFTGIGAREDELTRIGAREGCEGR